MSADDIAAELGVSRSFAYEILRQCTRIVVGRRVRVSRLAFETWKRRHEEPPELTPGEKMVATPRATKPRKVVEALPYVQEALGKNLKAAREQAGLSEANLAKLLGRTAATIRRAESGELRVDAKYVTKLLKACGLPPNWPG